MSTILEAHYWMFPHNLRYDTCANSLAGGRTQTFLGLVYLPATGNPSPTVKHSTIRNSEKAVSLNNNKKVVLRKSNMGIHAGYLEITKRFYFCLQIEHFI